MPPIGLGCLLGDFRNHDFYTNSYVKVSGFRVRRFRGALVANGANFYMCVHSELSIVEEEDCEVNHGSH